MHPTEEQVHNRDVQMTEAQFDKNRSNVLLKIVIDERPAQKQQPS